MLGWGLEFALYHVGYRALGGERKDGSVRACPKCQTKNEDSSFFCKKCGFKLSDSQFKDKKEKVLGEQKKKSPWMFVSLIIIAIALGGLAYWLIRGETSTNPKIPSQKVTERADYTGQTIPMVDI
jgi:hypothetical protein